MQSIKCPQSSALRVSNKTSRAAQSRRCLQVNAFWKKPAPVAAKPVEKKKEKKKQGFFAQTLDAFDLKETASQSDADLLYEAKYGVRGADGKMTPEQYAALKRKIGGTAKNFFKETVEETQLKTVKIRVSPTAIGGEVPYLPLLVGVVLAMVGTTAYISSL